LISINVVWYYFYSINDISCRHSLKTFLRSHKLSHTFIYTLLCFNFSIYRFGVYFKIAIINSNKNNCKLCYEGYLPFFSCLNRWRRGDCFRNTSAKPSSYCMFTYYTNLSFFTATILFLINQYFLLIFWWKNYSAQTRLPKLYIWLFYFIIFRRQVNHVQYNQTKPFLYIT